MRNCLSDPDGPTGRGLHPQTAGADKEVVCVQTAVWFPGQTQQTCGHMLLLLGGGHTAGECRHLHEASQYSTTGGM